jgi:uncharacterized protein (TIGR02117 family)
MLLKKFIRLILAFIAGLIFAITLYLIIALILSHIPTNSNFKETPNGIEIFVQSNGVHTNFVIPAKSEFIDWTTLLPYDQFEKVDSSFKYISFGWGDKDFYMNTPTWADLTLKTALKAIFFLGNGAMHINYIQNKPSESSRYKSLMISKKEYLKLINYINSTFKTDYSGKFIPIKHPGYSQYDCFYEAKGTFSFLKTCNVWVGEGLKMAGIQTSLWTPFDFSVLNSLD